MAEDASCVSLIAVCLLFCPLFLSHVCAAEIDREADKSSTISKLENEMIKDRQASGEDNDFNNEVDSYLRYIPSNSAKSQSGRINIIQSGVEYDYKFKAFGELPVELSLDSGYTGINNTTQVELPAHLTKFIAGINTTFPFFNVKRTYFYLELDPSFYGEDWDLASYHFRFESNYAFIYRANEKLSLVFGIQVFPEYRYPGGIMRDYPVSPLLGFIYKPNDKLEFNILPDNPNISYFLNHRLTLFIEENDFDDEYKVTKDGSKTRLRYTQAHIGTGLKFKVNKFIDTSLVAGEALHQLFKYSDSQGKVQANNGLYVEFKIAARM